MSKKKIGVIVHCSDTPNGRFHSAEDIHAWHRKRGWDGIGYHYVIRLDGTTERGRPIYWRGSHCKGYNDHVGICLIGRDKFTLRQQTALCSLLGKLSYDYELEEVVGHRDKDSGKDCPNFDVASWWNNGALNTNQFPLVGDL